MCLSRISNARQFDEKTSKADKVMSNSNTDGQVQRNIGIYEEGMKLKSPNPIFTSMKQAYCPKTSSELLNSKTDNELLSSNLNRGHCVSSPVKHNSVGSARRIKSELVMERLRQYDHTPRKSFLPHCSKSNDPEWEGNTTYIKSPTSQVKSDHTPRRNIHSHHTNSADPSEEASTTYVLKSPGYMDIPQMQHSNELEPLDNSSAEDSTFLVLSSPKLKAKLLNKSPTKATFVSHPLRYTKWNGKHSSKSPVKRPSSSRATSSSTDHSFKGCLSPSPLKLSSLNGLDSRNPSQFLHDHVNLELSSPKRKHRYNCAISSPEKIFSQNPTVHQHAVIREQSLSKQIRTSELDESSLGSMRVCENGRVENRSKPNGLGSISRHEPVKKINREFQYKKTTKSCSSDMDNRSSNSSNMDGHGCLNKQCEPQEDSIDDKVKSWLRTLNASVPFSDPPPLAGCQSPAASPWLRKSGNCVSNFGATLKTPNVMNQLDGRKYTPSKTAPTGHVNLKGKSLLEIFTKLKDRTKTDFKSKRLSPKKDRRRSLPFVRAKRKLKLVSSKNTHKSNSVCNEDDSHGIMCTKANLHYDEYDQCDRENETSPKPKICIVSPRIQMNMSPGGHVSEGGSPLKEALFEEHSILDMKKYILNTPMKKGNESLASLSSSEETAAENEDKTFSQQRLVKISTYDQSPSSAMKCMHIQSPDRKMTCRIMDQTFVQPANINCSSNGTISDRRLSCSPSVAMGKMQIRTPTSVSPRKRGFVSLPKACSKSPRPNKFSPFHNSGSNSPRTNALSPLPSSNSPRTKTYLTIPKSKGHSPKKNTSCSKSPKTNAFLTIPKSYGNSPRKNMLSKSCSNSPKINALSSLLKSSSSSPREKSGLNSPRKSMFSPSVFNPESEITSEKKLASLTQDLFEKCDRYNKYHTSSSKAAKQKSHLHNHKEGTSNNMKSVPHFTNGDCSVKSGVVQRPTDGRTDKILSEMPRLDPGQNLKTIKESLFMKYAIKNGSLQPLRDDKRSHSTPQKQCSKLRIDESISTICHTWGDDNSESESEVLTISPT